MARVLIDEELFEDLQQFFVKGFPECLTEEERAFRRCSLEMKIQRELRTKIDALHRRELFAASKTAPTEEAREKARKEYLDASGILPGFRWDPAWTDKDK